MTQTMRTIPKRAVSLEGLPDEVVHAFELMIAAWRKEVIQKHNVQPVHIKFAVWPGKVRGNFTRREIYEYL